MSISKTVMAEWVHNTVSDLEKLAVEVNKETVSVSTMVTENNISINVTLRELQQNKEEENVTHT